MADKIDYKKEYKELYLPKSTPHVIEVPAMQFIAVEGKGNPNDKDGEYSAAVGLIYALSYTIKMSKMGENIPEGYFDYVVPPLEGLWWMSDGKREVEYQEKSKYAWISMIRQPEFVTEDIFQWACAEVQKKKKLDTSKAKLMQYYEGKCVQCMHHGPFDDEPVTLEKMEEYMREHHLINDISEIRRHHEIYLKDPRKIDADKMRTVLRIPVKEEK
ncbi:GyrI-like domain-containing protein [Anaeromicropila herbilytica]|uniref:Transcriptional regulator n=1 Tax=Anaeromicropila herbilytica TaxID=2785025 RepID=A0A7R7IE53_9FIRM|nr:GyrI-like domain-containing protein [Anaeromicropila herbilytica]BCN31759.1 transcriptional regulator [Anaeromicropila herbilytica]